MRFVGSLASHGLLHASLPFPRLRVCLRRGQCAYTCLLEHGKQVFVVHTLSEVLLEAGDDNEGSQEAGKCLESRNDQGTRHRVTENQGRPVIG